MGWKEESKRDYELEQMIADVSSGGSWGREKGKDIKELEALIAEKKENEVQYKKMTIAAKAFSISTRIAVQESKNSVDKLNREVSDFIAKIVKNETQELKAPEKQDVQNGRNSEIDRRYEELNGRAENETQELKVPEKDEISEEQVQNALEKITSIATADVVPGADELLKEAFANAKQEQEQTLGNAEVANEHSPFSNHEEQKQQEERVEQDDSLAIEQARGGR